MCFFWELWNRYRTTCPAKWSSWQITRGLGQGSSISLKTWKRSLTVELKRFYTMSNFFNCKTSDQSWKIFYKRSGGILVRTWNAVFPCEAHPPNIANMTRELWKANNSVRSCRVLITGKAQVSTPGIKQLMEWICGTFRTINQLTIFRRSKYKNSSLLASY